MKLLSFLRRNCERNHVYILRQAGVYACGGAALLIGFLALLGWIFDIAVLRSTLPGLPPVIPISALGLLGLGVALLAAPRRKALSATLSAFVLAISSTTLVHYLLGTPLKWEEYAKLPPNTALCLALTSLSIGFFSLFGRSLGTIAVVLVFTSLCSIIAFAAALGIASGLTAAYGWGTFPPMALNSAVAFIFLCVGVIALQWPEGDSEHDIDHIRRVVPLYSTVGAFIILSVAMSSVMIPLFAGVEGREKETTLTRAKLLAAEIALGERQASLQKDDSGSIYILRMGEEETALPDTAWRQAAYVESRAVQRTPRLVGDLAASPYIVAVAPIGSTGDALVYVVEKRSILKWVNGHLLFSLFGSVLFTVTGISLLLRLLKPLSMVAFHALEVLRESERELDRRVKESTRELQQSIALNDRIFQYSVDILCCMDKEGRFQRVSSASLDVLGYTPEELLGRSYKNFVHEDDLQITEEEGARIVAGHSTLDFRNRYVRKDGKIGNIMWSAHWSQEDQLMFCVGRDITKLMEVEAQLKESVAFAHSVLDSLTSTTAVLDPNGKIIAVNNEWRSFAKSNGGNDVCIGGIGLNYLELCQAADGCPEAAASYEGIRKVLSSEVERFDLIYPCDSPTEKRWFLLRSVPLPKGGGAVVSHLDVTELKLSEVSLQELNKELELRSSLLESANSELLRTKNFLRAMIDHLPVAVFAKSGREQDFGTFKLWNQMSEELFGIPNRDVLGRTDYDFFPLEEADAFRERDELTFELRVPQRIEEENITSVSGGIKTLHTVKVPIFDSEGLPDTLLGISLDITDRKKAEAEVVLKAFQLEKASRYKSLFLANMSHEIRTPLTSIIGYTESLLEDEVPADEEKDALRTIHRNSRHLLGIINDILDFSKIEVGKLEFEMVETRLFDVIADVENLIRLQAQEKGISLEVVFLYPLPSLVVTDPTRLKQILINLMGNAVKFTKVGGVSVTVSHDGDVLEVEVKDTGIGMGEDQRERLFKPFSQGDTSTTRQFGGTGLGLTISSELAKRLGGHIKVKSKPSAGSTFTLSVKAPLAIGARMLKERPALRLEVAENVEQPERFSGKVLLAEDGEDNQRYLSLLLRRAGVDFVIVENGAKALERVKEEQFDLILMDMQMPVLDGYSATRALRGEGFTLPIVALTANAMKSDVERTIEAGCSSFLGKPFTRSSFLSTLARYLPTVESSGEIPIEVKQMLEEDREIKELILNFLDRLPSQFAELEKVYNGADWIAVKAASHKLAGAASLYCIREVGDAASALETAIKENDSAGIKEGMTALKKGVECVLSCRGSIESF